jgi:hypothetical protein
MQIILLSLHLQEARRDATVVDNAAGRRLRSYLQNIGKNKNGEKKTTETTEHRERGQRHDGGQAPRTPDSAFADFHQRIAG